MTASSPERIIAKITPSQAQFLHHYDQTEALLRDNKEALEAMAEGLVVVIDPRLLSQVANYALANLGIHLDINFLSEAHLKEEDNA